ncbi:MAG: FAD-binding protein [Candidatus Promineifilaceae bacterium]|nr:FAD-binding protein [Candidatus Promineifilaceae bacterium]
MTTPHRTNVSNVLIIGAGGGGLRAAIAAHEAGSEVTIVTKRGRTDAHTVLAAGGINAALGTVDPEDSWQQHFADTVHEGYFLSDSETVQLMVREAPAALLELADWGADFARLPDGRLDQRFFGAHTYRRTAYAGDYTGREIVKTLAHQVIDRGIPIHENQYVSHLLVSGRGAKAVCFGVLAFDLATGARTLYLADAVILAAGGHTRIWRRSSSRRDENTGDAMALALRAGVELADMELVQFHPTGMVAPETMAGTLVTEAVRGEGGRLYNAQGERYMARYDPERMELSTRDRVALANYTEIVEGRSGPNGGVFLDISHLPKETIIAKLPRMYRQFLEAQMLDISKEKMEVAPTAHYSMGGVVIDPATHATRVTGLYAVGEGTSGLHGANRLGGNSLAEIVVFGRHAGEAAAAHSRALPAQTRDAGTVAAAHAELDALIRPGEELARPLQRAIRNAMWETAGVVRDEAGLRHGRERLAQIRQASRRLDVRPNSEGYKDLALALDLRGSLLAAEATLLSALARTESRGAHQRRDYPKTDPVLRVNFIVELGQQGGLVLSRRPVKPVPDELREWTEGQEELAVAGRLLE